MEGFPCLWVGLRGPEASAVEGPLGYLVVFRKHSNRVEDAGRLPEDVVSCLDLENLRRHWRLN